jgi:hypothetical protein
MRFLFIFVDGLGLGENNPRINPLANLELPNLSRLLGNKRLLAEDVPAETDQATFYGLDACLGIPGLPQSATGQAALLTGKNISAEIGFHYGPKPNPEIAGFIRNGNLFRTLRDRGLEVALLNAYPAGYFAAIESGRRLFSAVPLAVTSAGVRLMTEEDFYQGRALSADFTGQGWRDHLGFSDTPVLEPEQAGARLADLASEYDFSFFEYWLTDYIGHRQDMSAAEDILRLMDRVLGGLLEKWDFETGLILLTSDHGNLEDLGTRKHTKNMVPCLLIGSKKLRKSFSDGLRDLTEITPAIQNFFPDHP